MSSSPSLYRPTAEEEAYGLFVFHKLFGTLPRADGTIQVETRTALKILESSGVDAILLRTIMNVANPENSKSLTTMNQFHVILRFIVLAQDGLLEREINRAFQQERNQTTPAAVFQKTLWMSSELRDFPLAKFEGIPVPTDDFLRNLGNRIHGTSSRVPSKSAPQHHRSTAPAPSPLPAPAPAPVPAPIKAADGKLFIPGQLKAPPHLHRTSPLKKPPIDEVTAKKRFSASGIQSALQQIEAVGVYNNTHDSKDRKPLDQENFELLQRIIADSAQSPGTAKSKKVSNAARSKELSEEQALQQAIYESTHDAASPKRAEYVPVAAAAAAAPESSSRLRIDSLSTDDDDQEDDDSDDVYAKKKVMKGDEAYAAYLASLDPSSENASTSTSMKVCTGKEGYSQKDEDYDRKPAAKPLSLRLSPPREKKVIDMKDAILEGRVMAENKQVKVADAVSSGKAMARKCPLENAKSNTNLLDASKTELADQYPQAVQELVINGFELEKAIQGYKMLGDNFDDIVLFLTSNMTVKELVINGFNIHKVVKAYDLMGDNMDELLAYLMTTV